MFENKLLVATNSRLPKVILQAIKEPKNPFLTRKNVRNVSSNIRISDDVTYSHVCNPKISVILNLVSLKREMMYRLIALVFE